MAQEQVTVAMLQLQRRSGGMASPVGDERLYVLKGGDFEETVRALKDAGFEPFDSVQDAIDRATGG